jgi:PAS domain S-box-containing protein
VPAHIPLPRENEKLVHALNGHFLSCAFDNAYTLHPRRLAELGCGEYSAFVGFLQSPNAAAARGHGGSLAREGMGEKTLLGLPPIFHEHLDAVLPVKGKEIDGYFSDVFGGYIEARESLILSDQEQLRRALAAALEIQSRELLVKNHAIDTSINGIMIADLDGRISYVNPSFISLWGFGAADGVIGMHADIFLAGENANKIIENLPRTGGWRGELAAKRKDGAPLTLAVAASHIKNESGNTIGIMASFVDITESRQFAAQIQQIQKMDALGQLAGGIAHDFNNLLAAIGGYIQLILTETAPDTQVYRDLMRINIAVEQGAGLTKQLRYFTRQASGKRRLFCLDEVAEETYELLRHTFPPDISIRLSLTPEPWRVEADPNQMSQVLVNLCVNGRDAIMEQGISEPGKPSEGTLTIETANVEISESQAKKYVNMAAGRYVRLCVSDTGVGMPQELIERLFIPFITTKSARSGTGLGLAVVYGIVRSHKGFIEVKSAQGKGSVFSIHLPAAETPSQDRSAKSIPPVLAMGEGTVLVVDDDAAVRDVMVRALGSCGYEVIAVDNGNSALSLYRERGKDIDLVILDLIMPLPGGKETFKQLKEVNPSVRVLVVTGYTIDNPTAQLSGDTADAVLEKPLNLKIFTDTVKDLISRTKKAPKKTASAGSLISAPPSTSRPLLSRARRKTR